MYRHSDEIIVSARAVAKRPSVAAVVPIMAVVFIAFLIIGLALPVLPLQVHQGLGFGAFVVGLVTGSQFGASLLSRLSAGHYADRRGPKRAVVFGLLTAISAGLLYALSLRFIGVPPLSVVILVLGRALLGSAESFIITGAVSWGLALGAPLGTALYSAGGFASVAIATTLMPLVTVLLVAPLSPVPSQCEARPPLKTVAAAVWLPGFGSALSSIGFGAIIAFGSLLAAQRGWTPVWFVFTAFAVSLVATRLLLGHVPDQLGGAKVALVCVLFEAAGLALIWLATDRTTAAAGAALAGFGYALVYPGLGIEVVRRAPSQSRGLAMGTYTVFLDVALGFGSPVLGLIAGRFGFDTAFLASALIALGAATFSIRLLFTGRFKRREQCLTSS